LNSFTNTTYIRSILVRFWRMMFILVFTLLVTVLHIRTSSALPNLQRIDNTSEYYTSPETIPTTLHRAEIAPYLQRQIDAKEQGVSFLAILVDQLDATTILRENNLEQAPHLQKRELIYSEFASHAAQTQASLRAWLDAEGLVYRPYYIMNMIEIIADFDKIAEIGTRPEVDRMVANPPIFNRHVFIDTSEEMLYSTTENYQSDSAINARTSWLTLLDIPEAQSQNALPYGLSQTGATEVWSLGYTGKNIIVASQDTGVEWDHPALKSRYRGWVDHITSNTTNISNTTDISNTATPPADDNLADSTVEHTYHWFDAWGSIARPASRCDVENFDIPCDDEGHGTHTVGTILGNETEGEVQVGMAPDAQWIGCRNMRAGFGTPGSYAACFEFFMAPYPQYGNPFIDGKPELSPHIINNSWGCPPDEGCDESSLRIVVETIRAAGIFIVSSAGNSGSIGCGSVQTPIAIHDATFSVGAHDQNGSLAGFSSRGPVKVDQSGRIKPDISAPGVDVFSTSINGRYRSLRGTSMASPHVAGAIALLWSAEPSLIGQIDLTEQILAQSAIAVPTALCNAENESTVPNNLYGHGKLNILEAVKVAQQDHHVQVIDCLGQPLPDAEVILSDNHESYTSSQITNNEGIATFPVIYNTDLFTVLVSAKNIKFEPQNLQLNNGIQSSDNKCQLSLTVTPTCYEPASVQLKVTNLWERPLDNVSVGLLDKNSGCHQQVRTDSGGIAHFSNLFESDYQIQIDAKAQGALFDVSDFSLNNNEPKVLEQKATHMLTYYPIFWGPPNK